MQYSRLQKYLHAIILQSAILLSLQYFLLSLPRLRLTEIWQNTFHIFVTKMLL